VAVLIPVDAVTGSVLVTGNVRHFPGRSRGGVTVRTPRELVDELRQQRT